MTSPFTLSIEPAGKPAFIHGFHLGTDAAGPGAWPAEDMNMAKQPYLLTFCGGALAKLPRHRRWHATYEAAREEALRVLGLLDNRAAHPAIIDGPDLGRAGQTIA